MSGNRSENYLSLMLVFIGVVGTFIAAVALIPSFGQWLYPREPVNKQILPASTQTVILSASQTTVPLDKPVNDFSPDDLSKQFVSENIIQWLATTLITSFIVQFMIFVLLYYEKVHLRTRWALMLNLVFAAVFSAFVYFTMIRAAVSDSVIYLVIAAIIVTAITFAVVAIVFVAFRDKKGVEFGEGFIKAMYTIDLETNFILSRFHEMNGDEVQRLVDHGLSHVLDTIAQVLDLDQEDDSHISLLLAENGCFRLLANRGIPVQRVSSIEQRFQYGETVVGVAGRAATTLQTVYIPDVTDDLNPHLHDWIPVEAGEQRQGSLFCLPIKKGVGANVERPLAVLSITSKRKQAFDIKTTQDFLTPIAAKIEIFLYLLELRERYSS